MAGTLTVQNIEGPSSGANANTIIVPAGQTLYAPGHMVQTTSNETSSSVNISQSASYSTAVSHVITPTSSSSKIRVHVLGIYYMTNNGNVSHLFRIRRNGSTTTHNWSQSGTSHYSHYRTSAINTPIPVPFNFTIMDEPSSTSSLTYTLEFAPSIGDLLLYSGVSMYLEEIAQ